MNKQSQLAGITLSFLISFMPSTGFADCPQLTTADINNNQQAFTPGNSGTQIQIGAATWKVYGPQSYVPGKTFIQVATDPNAVVAVVDQSSPQQLNCVLQYQLQSAHGSHGMNSATVQIIHDLP